MRKLHLVGYTPDLEGLIFTARRGSKSGGYVVAIEDALVDTIDEARRRRNGDAGPGDGVRPATQEAGRPGRAESTLTPREIQARLRSGRSIAQVAAEARVDLDWVERFAVPILAEQAQMVELARATTYSKPRLGPSAQPLGASVAWNLADRGVQLPDDATTAAWTAHQVHDAVWSVRLTYRSRGRAQEAAWELDTERGDLIARNRLASELGHVEKGRRRRVPSRLSAAADAEAAAAADEESEPRPARKGRSTARKATARKATARKSTARKSTARKSTARKSTARKSTARKMTAGTATARKSTARKAPARKMTAGTATAGTRTARTSTARKSTARTSTARKSTARKSTAGKATARTSTARKSTARPAAATTAGKKAATAAKVVGPRRSAPKAAKTAKTTPKRATKVTGARRRAKSTR